MKTRTDWQVVVEKAKRNDAVEKPGDVRGNLRDYDNPSSQNRGYNHSTAMVTSWDLYAGDGSLHAGSDHPKAVIVF